MRRKLSGLALLLVLGMAVGWTMFAPGAAAASAVEPAKVSVDADLEKEFLFVGAEVELTATVSPPDASTKLEWKVSDPSVFQIVQKNRQTFLVVKKMGQATVTVQAGKASDSVTLRAWDLVLAFSLLLVVLVILVFVVIIALDERRKAPPSETE